MITDQNANLSQELNLIDILGPNPQLIAFISDESAREILNQFAIKEGYPPACVQSFEASRVRSVLKSGIEPKVILLDLTRSSDVLNDTKSLIEDCPANTHLIVIGKDDLISLYRELKHAGVTDYLSLPLQENIVKSAINEAMTSPVTRLSKEAATQLKPFVVVIGAKGGVGASTVCVNLAYVTASEFNKKVCLIDLDLYHDSACVMLDLNQNAGLNDALSEVDRLDDTFLKRLILQKDDKLSVLTGQLPLGQDANFSEESIHKLVTMLRGRFDFIFADLPSSLNTSFSREALKLANSVIIVTDLSLVSIQAVLRLKAYLLANLPATKYSIVANQIFPAGGTISKSMFEKAIGSPVNNSLPFCKSHMLEGMNTGEPFIKTNKNHAFSTDLLKLLQTNYPQLKPVEKIKSSPFKKLWRPS